MVTAAGCFPAPPVRPATPLLPGWVAGSVGPRRNRLGEADGSGFEDLTESPIGLEALAGGTVARQ